MPIDINENDMGEAILDDKFYLEVKKQVNNFDELLDYTRSGDKHLVIWSLLFTICKDREVTRIILQYLNCHNLAETIKNKLESTVDQWIKLQSELHGDMNENICAVLDKAKNKITFVPGG